MRLTTDSSTNYRVPGASHVGTGAVWMLGGGACAVLAPFPIQHPIVGGTTTNRIQALTHGMKRLIESQLRYARSVTLGKAQRF
jgi:hypothetical protein